MKYTETYSRSFTGNDLKTMCKISYMEGNRKSFTLYLCSPTLICTIFFSFPSLTHQPTLPSSSLPPQLFYHLTSPLPLKFKGNREESGEGALGRGEMKDYERNNSYWKDNEKGSGRWEKGKERKRQRQGAEEETKKRRKKIYTQLHFPDKKKQGRDRQERQGEGEHMTDRDRGARRKTLRKNRRHKEDTPSTSCR